MHKVFFRIGVFSVLLLTTLSLLSQPDKPVEMADAMRSNGKIYVVVAVMVTLFAGLIGYVIRLDRKISKLEKEQ